MRTVRHTRFLSRILILIAAGLFLLPVQEIRADMQGTDRAPKTVPANRPKRMTPTKHKFMANRGIYIKVGSAYREKTDQFIQELKGQGVASGYAKGRGFSSITFQRVPQIHGVEGNDGLSIIIKSKKITVYFTTSYALERATELLQNMLVTGQGAPYWPGGTMQDWGTTRPTRLAVVDAASIMRPVREMEGVIRKQIPAGRTKEVYISFVNQHNWRMQTPSFERAEVAGTLYPSDGYYSRQDLLQIDQICRKNDLRMIPTLDLFSENSAFVSAFGHSVFSVEGMRFVRAAIEDCVDILRPKKICLGVLSDDVDVRYLQFVSGIAEMLQVELVIVDPEK